MTESTSDPTISSHSSPDDPNYIQPKKDSEWEHLIKSGMSVESENMARFYGFRNTRYLDRRMNTTLC